ncbi:MULTISPECIES: DUF6418 domain-containing protein [Bradyrhizobium]|uniref:DUF6418 domain-containing protein n=1 Tax=Bradyrhizobium yuanmingense TaxID=108015 RepID=A0A0R3C6S7_9BRAD|nr:MULTISPECIES: DUF6418 domain-containing protein [Bradyrhizobium]KRP93263.1 hypothetical protein AOQ72_26955 [Bradyrhizobium yuanmingense]MCA1477352.1 hypothetical protein [Bradyrhizobium sp. NBAIM08]TWI20076.1 hypothetical protein IQ15_06560 [Bradyrhizobium yuanmingense]SCB50562.1 hypothetical protein GA0061099_1012124 [Bradyrhizobium yuanmingense]
MTLLAGVSILLFIVWLLRFRSTIFLCLAFLLFTFVWRTISSFYIDLSGPILSSQLQMFIGPGVMTVFQSIAYFLTLLPFLWVFNAQALDDWARSAPVPEPHPSQSQLTLSDVTFYVSVLFLILLFGALIQGGVIPLFAKIERWTFNEQANFLHRFVIERGDMVCFWWGTMFVAEWLRRRRYDYRFLVLLAAMIFYMFLVGGRFSPFYRYCGFFIIPFSAALLVQARGFAGGRSLSLLPRIADRRIVLAGTGIIAATVAMIAFALYWNLTRVRGYEGEAARGAFVERALVQPSEIGWASYQRVLVNGDWDARRAFDALFGRPIVAGRNTTPQFLMSETIGEPRTTEHITGGFQFAGGFPEIFFELFGPYLSWFFLLGAGWLTALISAIMIRSIVAGRYLTAMLSFYVLYGFYVMYIGGMLNFAATPTYWIKIAALFAAIILEERWQMLGRPVLPWVLADKTRLFRRSAVSKV